MTTLQTLKQKGRTLRKHLSTTFGHEVSLSQAYEALAAIEGLDWATFSAIAKQTQSSVTSKMIGSGLILETDLSKPAQEQTLVSLCQAAWDSAVARWKNEGPSCEYIIESTDIFQALGDFNIVSLGDEGYSDSVETLIEDHLELYGFERQARLIFEGKTSLAVPFNPEENARDSKFVVKQNIFPLTVFDINLVDVLGEYDVPENTTEWQWIAERHTFAHKGNNVDSGVYEFMVNIESSKHFEDIPVKLVPFFEEAKAQGAIWILFNQG